MSVRIPEFSTPMNTIEGASVINSGSGDTALVVCGGVHGNEPAGVIAIEKITGLVKSGDWKINGAVYGLVGNPAALQKSVRFIDENLNRAFNGYVSNLTEGKRAREIVGWLKEIAAVYKNLHLVDLHSVSIGDTRIAVFNAENPGSKQWALQISPIPFRMGSYERIVPGTLMGAVEKFGGIAVSIECGNHSSETGATVGLEHVESALLSLGMLTGARTSFKGRVDYEGAPRTYTLIDIIKPTPGFSFISPDVRSEMFVAAGEPYARDNTGDIRAPQDCYLIMPAKNPQPEDFDAGFLAIKTD